MRPQDVVALLLTFLLMGILLSNTNLMMLFVPAEELSQVENPINEDREDFWHDITNVLLGGLIGYIAGRKNGGNKDE